MCCIRINELRLFEQLLLYLQVVVRDSAPHLLEPLILHHILFNLLLLVRVSALQMLKELLLHLMLLVRVVVVHRLDHLPYLVILHCESNIHIHIDSN